MNYYRIKYVPSVFVVYPYSNMSYVNTYHKIVLRKFTTNKLPYKNTEQEVEVRYIFSTSVCNNRKAYHV